MADINQFLIEDYKLKTDFLNKHFSRMLTRFNFFLTISAAMFVLSFEDGFDHGTFISQSGFALSLLWFLFAAADNAAADNYRMHVAFAFEAVNGGGEESETHPFYPHAGYAGRKNRDLRKDIEAKGFEKPKFPLLRLLSMKHAGLGVTEIPPVIALAFAAAWGARWCYAL